MRHFYMHETRRKYIFMVFLTSDFAIFCCSWNRDTISCREVSRTIPPIIISFNMKWTLNIVQKLLYDFIEKKFETNHTVCYEIVLLSFEQHLCQREISSPTHKHFQNTDPRFPQEPKIKFFWRINSIKLTCIRSKIPSSDSDESTQKMK